MIDPELLKAARETQARLEDADRAALLSRADYHTSVRRLHLAGASLREIAEALSLSHQRVQQIVQGAGGSWWTKIWKTRNTRADAICTGCDRPPSEVAKLIAGPHVYICDECIGSAEAALAQRPTPKHATPFSRETGRPASRCSFCNRRASAKRAVAHGGAVRVCAECLRLCGEILEGRGTVA